MGILPRLRRGWPAAFLFDLDGTLVDTEMLWMRAIAAFLEDRGASMPLSSLSELVVGQS